MIDRALVVASWDEVAARQRARVFIHPSALKGSAAYEASGVAAADMIAPYFARGERLLDFGAGDGRVAVPLHDRGYVVTAVDSSPAMLDRLRARRPAIPTVVNDGTGLADVAGPFDGIYALAVLIHHGHADGAAIITELARALVRGGRLIFDVPVYDEPYERAGWIDVTVWDPTSLAAAITDAGLNVTRLVSQGPRFDRGTHRLELTIATGP